MSIKKGSYVIAGTPRTTGGVEIGDMGFAPLGIDESLNLRRYLNGQVISQTQFASFTTKVKSAVALFPSLATTESNWQSEKALSKFGQVGKFVIDDTAQTIRLPAVVNPQGLLGLSGIGNLVNESLPNITGSWAGVYNSLGDSGAVYGQFSTTDATLPESTAVGQGAYAKFNINASRSSSTYQNNAPVQQEAVQYPYYIQVATGIEETLPAIREYQVNNSDYFGKSMYSDIAPDNASWLASNGQYNARSVYPDYYDWLLTQMNAGIKGFKGNIGYAWKSQTADIRFWTALRNPSVGCAVYGGVGIPFAGTVTAINPDGTLNFYEVSTGVTYENLVYTESENINNEGTAFGNIKFANDYDFVINTTDQTFRLPLLNGEEGLLDESNVINNPITGSFSSTTPLNYTATKNGFIAISVPMQKGQGVPCKVNGVAVDGNYSTANSTTTFQAAVKRGDIVSLIIDYLASGVSDGANVESSRFIPYKGNGTLYYYVGDTVQDAALINAGAVLGQLSNKADIDASNFNADGKSLLSGLGMPSNRYINLTLGASGSTYTAPANGWFRLVKKPTATGQHILFSPLKYYSGQSSTDMEAIQVSNWTEPMVITIPVLKGDQIYCYYDFGGETIKFEFRYAEGDQ